MDHQRAIECSVYVELDGICPELYRPQKGGDRILGQRLMCSAVGDFLGDVSAHWPQLAIGIVALGT